MEESNNCLVFWWGIEILVWGLWGEGGEGGAMCADFKVINGGTGRMDFTVIRLSIFVFSVYIMIIDLY